LLRLQDFLLEIDGHAARESGLPESIQYHRQRSSKERARTKAVIGQASALTNSRIASPLP
jgi:hypothetical protein